MPETQRPQRADAARNLSSLLAAARQVFAAAGVDAPSRQIAEAAGVGVGTLYRHFPRRSDLILAVLARELDECVEEARRLAGTGSPQAALTDWIDRYVALVATKQGLAAALHSGDPAYDGLPERLMGQLAPAFGELLERAVEAGQVRGDVSAAEILTALALVCQPVPGTEADFGPRMAALLLSGLKPGAPGT